MYICKNRNVHFKKWEGLFFACPGPQTPPCDPCCRLGNVARFSKNGKKNVHFIKCTFSLKIMLILMYFLYLFNVRTKCS